MSDDLKKPAHEKERHQSLQENAAVLMSTEPNEKSREMESPKTDATKPTLETQDDHLGNGHLPTADGIAQKNAIKSSLPLTTLPEIKHEGQTEKQLSQEASTKPAIGETKKEKHYKVSIISMVVGAIAAVIMAIIAVLAFFKDELLKPPSPQFKIKNFQTAPDSVIIIIAQNEPASRNSALDVEFDGMVFPAAGQVISKSNPRQWAFRLKDNNPLASQIEDGKHVLRVGFPGDALLPDRLYIIFKTNDEPQFGIKNLNTHPDSAIVIIWRNKGVTRLIPLNVEFDEKLFVEAGQVIPDSQPQQWSFRLKKLNPPAALLRNGIHRMRVGFPGMQYSEFFDITFAAKALPESIVVETPIPAETPVDTTQKQKPFTEVKPPPKNGGPVKPVIKKLTFPTLDSNIVKVSLDRNGSDPISKDYIDRTAFILTTLNQHYYADSLKVWNFSSLNDNATTASLAKFSRTFLTKGAYVSKSQIIVARSEKENHVVLGPITIFFNTEKTAKSLYLIFNQERKPKLTDIRLE